MKLFLQAVLAAEGNATKLLDEVIKDDAVKNFVNIWWVEWRGIKGILENLISWWGIIPNYIQWTIYFALIIAMILIIYNGVVIITAQGDEGKLNSAKTRLVALLAGVVLLFAFPTLIKLVVSLISNL